MTITLASTGINDEYSGIRDAIIRSQSIDTVLFGTGTYYNPDTFGRNISNKSITYQGQGSGTYSLQMGAFTWDDTRETSITGPYRFLTMQSDREDPMPASIIFRKLRFYFGDSANNAGSGYMIQSGDSNYSTGILQVTKPVPEIIFENTSFTGFHTGAVSSGPEGGNPSGVYSDIRASTLVKVDNVYVALQGQGGDKLDSFSINPLTNGSAFLFANSQQVEVLNSFFDESGYRNSLDLWGQAAFPTNVNIQGNVFFRSVNKDIRQRSESFVQVSGMVANNTFSDGAYADVDRLSNLSLSFTSNTFNILPSGFAFKLRASEQTSGDLANLKIENNIFNTNRGGVAIVTGFTSPVSLKFGPNSVDGVAYANLIVGGTVGDTLTGGSSSEWLSGGSGNDTIRGNGGVDALLGAEGNDSLVGGGGDDTLAGGLGSDSLTGGDGRDDYLFSTVFASSANIDRIIGFSSGRDSILLDHAIFDQIDIGTLGVDRLEFTFNGAATRSETRIVVDNSSSGGGLGGIFYDPDGSGSLAPAQFAVLNRYTKDSTAFVNVADFVIF